MQLGWNSQCIWLPQISKVQNLSSRYKMPASLFDLRWSWRNSFCGCIWSLLNLWLECTNCKYSSNNPRSWGSYFLFGSFRRKNDHWFLGSYYEDPLNICKEAKCWNFRTQFSDHCLSSTSRWEICRHSHYQRRNLYLGARNQ